MRLDKLAEVVLELEPHDPDWPLSAFPAELGEWERGVVAPDKAARDAAISLRDRPAPELDAVLWLNTAGHALKLADLRGKFVLLDFWFTGCGPCHGDFPSVKLVHELYKDKGVGSSASITTPATPRPSPVTLRKSDCLFQLPSTSPTAV